MARPGVTIELTFNRLDELAGQLRTRAGQVIHKTALQLEAEAKARAPVDTGTLRRSIHAVKQESFAWVVAPGVAYALYVELGTVHMAAQPFMTPAAEAVRPAFEAAMAKLLEGG